MAQFSFETESVEKRENNYTLLPPGWYTAQVVESDIVPLKRDPNGRALKLTIQILSEGYQGRKVFSQLNVRHSNPQTERIAQQQLRELCESIGISRMTDTSDLHNKPMQIKVKIRKDDSGQYEDQNEVVAFKSAEGAAATLVPGSAFPPAQRAAQPVSQPAVATGAATPPWAKKAA